MPPPRTLLTIAAALCIAVVVVWVITRLPRTRELGGSARQRTLIATVVTVALVVVIAWLLLVFPAYWD